MPHMTVLLPALNAEGTIKAAVSSSLLGMPQDSELYVLDDGSTDGTAEKAWEAGTRRGVVDKRLKVVSRPPAGGLSKALNSMLADTDSALIARMDADDLGLPWRFRASLPALVKSTDVVFTQVAWMKGRRITPGLPAPIFPREFPLHLLLTNPVVHPTMIARREAFSSVGGFRDVPAEDYDMWLRMAAEGVRLCRLPWNCLIYRVHPQQITATAGWHERSWSNPLQAVAFADLSEKLTGERVKRIVAIAQLGPDEREAELRRFETLVDTAIGDLPRARRPLLRRRLKARMEWARSHEPST